MPAKMRPFHTVPAYVPGRSVFDLSHRRTLTCDMGQLIPTFLQDVIPGDKWQIGNELVLRFQPLVAPIMHEINAYIHYFFVPYRLLWADWESWITGGVDGSFADPIPTWHPTLSPAKNGIGSLWDYMGFPTTVDPQGAYPVDWPRRAYNLVYNQYYRDETNIAEVALSNEDVLVRSWEKDYFTSALPWQQRGTAPALPISGSSSAVFATAAFQNAAPDTNAGALNAAGDNKIRLNNADAMNNFRNALNNNTVSFASATTFTVADLRLAFQIQKWLERNARAGVRYTEFLRGRYGVSPRDDRLQRPEYLGGFKTPVIVSEVLQTSSTDTTTPQGNMAGHGMTVDRQFSASYFAQEFGLIIGMMSIMPRTQYQQGINRQWLRSSRYEYYSPEFAHLSEQAILRREIYADNNTVNNNTIFGYQGRYDEYRYVPSSVHGQMRTTFDYWHLGRIFASAPALNSTFLNCVPDKRIFAVPSEPGLLVTVGNLVRAVRPLPIIAEPGFIDH